MRENYCNRLEKIVRDASIRGEHDRIQKIVDQLCHDYAYAVHQPHARNGGLIGLAAASIALGSVSRTKAQMSMILQSSFVLRKE